MKFPGIPVVVDPDMPPGTIELRSTVANAAGVVRLQLGGDELLAEEITSIGESSPFLVRIESCTEPIRCECCGTWVTMLDKVPAGADQPGTWKPGIWEADRDQPLRKHTLRRAGPAG